MAGGTNYRPFAPEVWSSYVKVYFKERLTAAQFFMNFSDELKGGGDTITLPSLTTGPAVGSFTTTTGAISDFVVVETRTTLTINNWKYSSKKFSDFEWGRIASKYNLQNMYLREDIAYRLAENLDATILTDLRNMNFRTGTSLVSMNNTTVQEAVRISHSGSMPQPDMAFFIHPNVFFGQLLRRNQYYDASIFGKAVISDGFSPVANLYGYPVYLSLNVPTGSGIGGDGYPSTAKINALVHKRAIVYAIGNIDGMGVGPRLATMPVADAKAFRVIGDLAYGISDLDKNAGVKMVTVQ